MPKQTAVGDPIYPDLTAVLSLSSQNETSGILLKKLRSLLDTAFGESEVLMTETRSTAKKLGNRTSSTVSISVEVYYPKE